MSSKHKTLAQQIAELQDLAPQDFDPEDDGFYDRATEEDSDYDGEGEDGAATEHYEEVGKSKLRKPAAVPLGPAYRGSKVSREALQSSDEEDPFERDHEDSDGGAAVIEEEASDEAPFSDDDMDGGAAYGQDDDDDDMMDDESSDHEEDIDDSHNRSQKNGSTDIHELRKLVLEDQKAVASTLLQARKTDVKKGKAIRSQRSTFDALLNVRIKLQPGLVATNSILAFSDSSSLDDVSQAVAAAESAALTLWQTIDDLKNSLFEARTGQKRKHFDTQASTDLHSMWHSMQQYEKDVKRQRNSNLDTWASKTRATMNAAQGRRLNPAALQQSLTDVLSGQLSEMSRLVAKTAVPRSCAPIQAAASEKRYGETTTEGSKGSLPIYDDADFYGPLLQALVAQRSSDAAALSAMNVSFVSQPWQAMREAKTKKLVDTKASKGRKLRYNVHEKLQNIMASENRAVWSDRQCDELFASLQGRTVALDEHDSGDDEQDTTAQSLRLFAS